MSYISYSYQQFTTGIKHAVGAGGITPSGTLAIKFAIAPVGSITPTSTLAIIKNADDIGTVGGGVTPTGDITEIIVGLGSGKCEGSITPTGALIVGISVWVVDTAGILGMSGALNLQTQITPRGSITPTGSLAVTDLRVIAAGSITPTGALTGGAPVKLTNLSGGYQDPVFIGILTTVLD